VDEDRPVGLVLELLQLSDDVVGDDRRVVPLRILERGRDDDLPVIVELVRELASREGQAAAKPSYVTRPSSVTSAPIISSSLNWFPSSPRSYSKVQPPCS
jgi:hypothetical protein